MVIKRKSDVEDFLSRFQTLSEWDGTKHYFTFKDTTKNGCITVMNYPNGEFTFHRKNDLFWDVKEHPIIEDEMINVLWKHRKSLNPLLKSR